MSVSALVAVPKSKRAFRSGIASPVHSSRRLRIFGATERGGGLVLGAMKEPSRSDDFVRPSSYPPFDENNHEKQNDRH